MDKNSQIGFFSAFSISAGGMISSGLFVLPALVYEKAGSFILLSYALASLLMLPASFSMCELGTAMPRAGGTYFYIGRSLGNLFGYFTGVSNWLTVTLKGAFALMGMGVFLQMLLPVHSLWITKSVALFLVVLFTVFNLLGVKESTRLQNSLVGLLLCILCVYVARATFELEIQRFFVWPESLSLQTVLAVAGSVCISYGGLTKVAAVAHQIKSPHINFPRAILAAFVSISLLYLLVIAVTIGILDGHELAGSLAPLSYAASTNFGQIFGWLLSLAAILAFATTANAAILTAAQAPLAMAKDGLLPLFFAAGKEDKPIMAILATSLLMAMAILLLDLQLLVKVASVMMIILFLFVHLAVIAMRESRLIAYRPTFLSPFYPLTQIFGLVSGVFLIMEIGNQALIFSLIFFVLTSVFYRFQRPTRVQESAVHLTLKRLLGQSFTNDKFLTKTSRLRNSSWQQLLQSALFIDAQKVRNEEQLLKLISLALSLRSSKSQAFFYEMLCRNQKKCSFSPEEWLFLPHLVCEEKAQLIIIRQKSSQPSCIFALSSSSAEQNLYYLSMLARLVQEPYFHDNWQLMADEQSLRRLLSKTNSP